MKRRIFSLIVIIAISFECLTGCSSGSYGRVEMKITQAEAAEALGTGSSDDRTKYANEVRAIVPAETVTLNVYSQVNNSELGPQEGWFAQVLLDEFNVKLNYSTGMPLSVSQRLNQMRFADYDIIIWASDEEEFQTACSQDLLLDWRSTGILDSYGGYIRDNMQAALEKSMLAYDGKIYGIGHDIASDNGEISGFYYHPDIRWDLYEQIGMPKVTTPEDYIDIFRQMKEICPESDSGEETYGIASFRDWDNAMCELAASTVSTFYGLDEMGCGFYDVETGDYLGCLDEESHYIEALKFYNELYREGLFDPESVTMSYADCLAKYADGAEFFSVLSSVGADAYNSINHTADGKMMLPLAAESQKTLVYGLGIYGGNKMWTICSGTEYPELCMAIINYLCTPEGKLTMEYGPRGVCWDYDSETGNVCLTQIGYDGVYGSGSSFPLSSGYSGTWEEGVPKLGNTTWALGATIPGKSRQTFDALEWKGVKTASVIEHRWREQVGFDSEEEYLKSFSYAISKPNTYTSGDMRGKLSASYSALKATITNNSWNAIYAKSDEEFDQTIEKMDHEADMYGYEMCVDFFKREANRRLKSEK